MLLGCECGEWGCWPLTADIEISASQVVWGNFRNGQRDNWDYSALGPFTFERAQVRGWAARPQRCAQPARPVSGAAAQLVWEFDVITALHDDAKLGGECERVRSRVLLCRSVFPSYGLASETAGAFAVAVHGGMPVAILPRY